MNLGALNGTIMKLDSSVFGFTQIDRAVWKLLASNQGDVLWELISNFCVLYGAKAERQFLHSLISSVVACQIRIESLESRENHHSQGESFSFPAALKELKDEADDSTAKRILAGAQSLLAVHYELNFSKPTVITALHSAFQSFKTVEVNGSSIGSQSTAKNGTDAVTPSKFLGYLGRGLNLTIFKLCLCSVAFYGTYVSGDICSEVSVDDIPGRDNEECKVELYEETVFSVKAFLKHLNSSEEAVLCELNKIQYESILGLISFVFREANDLIYLEEWQKFLNILRTLDNVNTANPLVCALVKSKPTSVFKKGTSEASESLQTDNCDSSVAPLTVTMALDPEANGQVITFDPGAVEFVLEMGPGTCNSIEECRASLSTVGQHKLTPAAVSRIMVGMIQAHETQQLNQSAASQNIWGDSQLGSLGKDASGDKGQPWNGKVFVQALVEIAPNFKWIDVFPELDYPGFTIKDGRPFRSLIETLRFGLQLQKMPRPDQFPIETFYRKWNNPDGQLSLLKCCLNNANSDVFSFADFPYHAVVTDMLKSSGDKSYEPKEIQTWKSIELLELLMWLSEAGQNHSFYSQVQELFQIPINHCPDILLLGLVQLTSPANLLRQELMQLLFPVFFNNHVNSAVILQHAWHSGTTTSIRPIMIHAMSEWYLRGEYDQAKLSRILDIAQDLKALPLLLNANNHIFIIDLACLASRREFLKLDKWLSDKIRDHGEVFILSLIKVLNRRIIGKDENNIPPKTAQLPPETVNVMIQCLHQCVGKVSPEVNESILSMVTTYNILLSKSRPPNLPAQPQNVIRSHRGLDGVMGNPSPSPGLFQPSGVGVEPTMSALGSTLAGLNLAGVSSSNVPPMSTAATPGSPSRLLGPNFGPSATSGLPGQNSAGGGSGAYPLLSGLQLGGPNTSSAGSASGLAPAPASGSQMSGMPNSLSALANRMAGSVSSIGMGPNNVGSSNPTGAASSAEKRSVPHDPSLMFSEIQPGDISKEAEDEANSYFHRIYSKPPDPTMSIDEVLDLLKRFQDSSIRREREVFQCMLRNLFDEYKFFPQYPDKELHTTAQLFGGIIEHGLVSTYLQLGVALRFVVDALKKPPNSKMYYFGIAALDRFKGRLKEYPQYCQHLSTIPHFSQFPEHLIEYIECGVRSQEPPRSRPSVPSTPSLPTTAISSSNSSTTVNSILHSGTSGSTTPKLLKPISKAVGGGGPSLTGRPSIANATNITTLLVATEKEEKTIAPPENVQDKTAFIFNNLNQMNLAQKCEELKEIIGSDHWHWVAQYLVMKRASIELNFHTLYSNLLDTLRVMELNNSVLRETHRNIKILLKTDKSAGNFADRQLLKNLGHWLGMITVMRNRPILLDDLDIKSLIIEAYRRGLQDLLYVVPFAAKIMESCARSVVFKPPCPWTMSIMNVLAELHREPEMKLNLKFEIEVLCKALTIEVSDLKPKGLLKDDNAFKIHVPQLSYPTQQGIHQASSNQERVTDSRLSQFQHRLSNAEGVSSMMSKVQTVMDNLTGQKILTTPPPQNAHNDDSSMISQAATVASMSNATTQQLSTVQPPLSSTPTLPMGSHEPKFAYLEVDTANLNSHLGHITINNQIPLLQARPNLKQYVRPAVEKAIQDLLLPVVERSIKYTINACEQIIKKDFALDHEENRMRNGAHHMMRYLTAGMAMITSRDHIFIAISTNLKQAFQTAIREPALIQQLKDSIEQAGAMIAQDNMELACVFIQKTAVEQAIIEIDKRLAPEYEHRKLAKSEGRRYFDSVMMSYQSERIPDPIRVKQSPNGGPLSQQLAVYEDFTRNIPGFLPPPDGDIALSRNKGGVVAMPGGMPGITGPSAAPGAGDELLSIYEKLFTEIQNYHEGLNMSNSPSAQQLSGGIRALMDAIGHARNTRSVVGAIGLLQKAVEGLLEGLAAFPSDPEIIRFRDAHLMVLKALQDTRAFGQTWVNRQVTKCLLEVRPELKYNIEAVDTLIRANLVNMLQFDNHLALAMEKGTNVLAVAFAMQLVQMYLIDDKYSATVSENDLYNTVHMLGTCAAVNRQQPDGLLHLIELLRNSSVAQENPANFMGDRVQPVPVPAHVPNALAHGRDYDDPQGLVERSEILLREWVRIYLTQGTPKDSNRAFQTFLPELSSSGILRSDEVIGRFLRICVQCCVNQVYQGLQAGPLTLVRSKCYQSIDALVRLVSLLIRHIGDTTAVKVGLLNKFLGIVAGLLIQEHELAQSDFQQLPFHRLFIMLFYDLNTADPIFESISMQVLTGFSNTMHILNPTKVPGFAYAWLEIVGNRMFIARMLALAADQKCWAMYCQLILDLFRFLFPFLRNAELAKPVATLYKGTLRVLLVILHDFPDFLCDYCYHFLDAIPPNCIQMRNLVLSAFPRNMRLPDPFTANLKFEMLPDTAMPPRILSNVGAMIQPATFKKDLDSYLKVRTPVTFLTELRTNLQVLNEPGTRYNIPLMNALVLYVGSQHIQAIRNRNQTPNMSTVAHTSHMDIFQNLAVDLDTEGRYLFLNALANQLRFPSSHTHYFSLVILYLFAQSNTEDVQEQITRVLLERLVVNRPHPWGLLVTFIELIKNPTYKFWQHEFVHCAQEVEKLFDSVARSCMVTRTTPMPTSAVNQSAIGMSATPGTLMDSNGSMIALDGTGLDQM